MMKLLTSRIVRAKLAMVLAALVLLAGAACSRSASKTTVLDTGKLATVVIGRSSRNDVFAALGRPSRTEQSGVGETWIYETKPGDAGGPDFVSGAAAVSGIVGAFVPYAGLVGSGLGLAGTAVNGTRGEPDTVSVAVSFGADGVVRNCVYSSTAAPAGVSGSAEGPAKIMGCQKPPGAAMAS